MTLKIIGRATLFLFFFAGVVFLAQSQPELSLSSITQSLTRFTAVSFLAAMIFALAQVGCGAGRFWLQLPRGVRWGQAAHAYSVGQFLNTFLPARAGDVLKIALLRGAEVPAAKSVGALIAEKAVDVAALVVLLLLTGAQHLVPWQMPSVDGRAIAITAVGAIGVLSGLWLWARRKPESRLAEWLGQLVGGLSGLIELPRLFGATLFGVGAWAAEAMALMALVSGLGFGISFPEAMFVLAILNLAIAIPISVANLGTFEASIVFALGQFGVPINEAIAIAAIHHLGQYLAITVWAGTTSLRKMSIVSETNPEFRVGIADKAKAIAYYDRASQNYDESVNRGLLAIPRAKERMAVLKLAGLDRGVKTMLDVGCGGGFYSLEAKRHRAEVHSVDASPRMVSNIKGRVDRAEVADIETLDMGTRYERVVCAGVMDFVLHPEKAFRNLCAHVATDGRLVILAPRRGIGGVYYRLEKLVCGIRINLYSRDWFERIASEYQLTLVQFETPLPTNMALAFEKTN